jgi:hypothetical protein
VSSTILSRAGEPRLMLTARFIAPYYSLSAATGATKIDGRYPRSYT